MPSCVVPPPPVLPHDNPGIPLGRLYDKVILGRENVQRRYESAHAGSSMLALRMAKPEELLHAVAALLRVEELQGAHLYQGIASFDEAHAQSLLLSLLSINVHNACLVSAVLSSAQVRGQSSFLSAQKRFMDIDDARLALREATQPRTLITPEHMAKRMNDVKPHMPTNAGASSLVVRYQEHEGQRDDKLYWQGTGDIVVQGEVVHSLDRRTIDVCSEESNEYLAHAPSLNYNDAHNAHVQNERVDEMKHIKALVCTQQPMAQQSIAEVERTKTLVDMDALQTMPGHFDSMNPTLVNNKVRMLRAMMPMLLEFGENAYKQTHKALQHVGIDLDTLADVATVGKWTADSDNSTEELPEVLLQKLRDAGETTLRDLRSTCASKGILLDIDTAKSNFDILDDALRYSHVNRIARTDDVVEDALVVLCFMCNAGEYNWHAIEAYMQQAQRLSNALGDKICPYTKEPYGRIEVPSDLARLVPAPPLYSESLSRGLNMPFSVPHRCRSRSGVAVEKALALRDQLRKEVGVSLLKVSAAEKRYEAVMHEVGRLPPTKLSAFAVLRWGVLQALAKHRATRHSTEAPTAASSAPKSTKSSAQQKQQAIEDGTFKPSATFQGAKPSYEFRTGDFGTGYYLSAATEPQTFGSAPAALPRTTVDMRFASSEHDALRTLHHYRTHIAKGGAFVVVAGQSQCAATQDAVDAIASHSDRAPVLVFLVSPQGSAARVLCPDNAVPWVRTFDARSTSAACTNSLASELRLARKALSPYRRYDGTLRKALRRVGLTSSEPEQLQRT